MNYKITCHLMPWELDYALLSFMQLQKAKHYISNDDCIFVDVTLNLSNYLIDWNLSKIPKDFFIKKFNHLTYLLNGYTCRFKIYDDNELYGGLNAVSESTEEHIDFYMILNPDMYFSEKSLYYLIESSKLIHNKYFVITQQLAKLWDSSWDEISHDSFSTIDYDKWHTIGVDRVRNLTEMMLESPSLVKINNFKWAGWMDLYNKHMWTDFWTYHTDWAGYGAHDHYTMILAEYAKQYHIDFQQYMLKNQLVYPYWANESLIDNSSYYKDMLKLHDIPNQRDSFDRNLNTYLTKGLEHLIEINK